MNQSLYYCMSNTQLRKIAYACSKSIESKNKAAAILRFRKNRNQQQKVSLSGFSFNFCLEKFELIPNTFQQHITRKTKGNLKNYETHTIIRSCDFSNIQIGSAGSLSLQGRSPSTQYKEIFKRREGVRRNRITRPRKRIEVPEDVPSSYIEQPAKLETSRKDTQPIDINLKNKPIMGQSLITKICKGAHSSGLNQERAVDPTPVSAYLQIIARMTIKGVAGVICLSAMVLILIVLFILLKNHPFIAFTIVVFVINCLIYNSCCSASAIDQVQKERQLLTTRNAVTIDRFGNVVGR